ncbi:MAG: mechanosensitive ion channel [Polyangiales bacterium]|nr:mechanosensitive ion channel [Sandaracinaceae bacterium]
MDAFLHRLPTWLKDPTVGKLVAAVFSVLVVIALVRLSQRGATRYIHDSTASYRVRKALSVMGYVGALLAVAGVFSDGLGQLTVVFGVAGAGIAFALQEVIASVAGWIAISFGGFYKVSDRVQLGGIKGDVIDIGILRTTLAELGVWVDGDLYNGRMVRVANSFVFKEPVVNYSGDFPFLWDELKVPIRFGSDLDLAQALMTQVTEEVCQAYEAEAAAIWKGMEKKYPLEPATTKPLVTLAFDQNWVTFTVRYTVRFDQRRMTKHRISSGLLSAIDASAGKVSVAAAALELFPMKPFETR